VSESRGSIGRPTRITWWAMATIAVVIASSLWYVRGRYASLPPVLPVHFKASGLPNGWQYKTPARVLLPVFVQLALAATLGAIGILLLSRHHGEDDADAPDVRAAAVAAEAVILITLVWVAFQGYAAWALMRMWQAERAGLGRSYVYVEIGGAFATVAIAIRAHRRLGRPEPRPFVAEHWRLGQLYNNALDPALFVPTRDGRRWTLNFGRPVAAALLAIILLLGVVGPTVILALLLRSN
jgi:uncharacterized membrane protein